MLTVNPFEEINARLAKIESLLLANAEKSAQKVSQQNEEDKLMNLSEVASFLGLSPATIYSKVSRKEIPYMKYGNRLFFSQKEITSLIKDNHYQSHDQIMQRAEAYLNNND